MGDTGKQGKFYSNCDESLYGHTPPCLINAESSLDFLDVANRALKANPLATLPASESLQQKVDDLESRCRRNNLPFIGFL